MAGITFKNVRKVYDGGFVAVDDFNLEIADKEFVVLVGPSGCGKSTTLRMTYPILLLALSNRQSI